MQRVHMQGSHRLANKIDAIAKASDIANAPDGDGSGTGASKGAEASPAASGIYTATGGIVSAELSLLLAGSAIWWLRSQPTSRTPLRSRWTVAC